MSPTVRLTPQEVVIAATIGVYRNLDAMRNNRKQTYGTISRGAWDTDIEACCAEMAFAKWANRYWSGALRATAESGDVGEFEIRSSPLADARLLLHDANRDDAIYVLVTGSAPEFCLCGWILGRDGKDPSYWTAPDGKRWCFAVPREQLIPMDQIPLLTWEARA